MIFHTKTMEIGKKLEKCHFYLFKSWKSVLPIEIKSGKDYKRHSALSNIMEILNYKIDEAFVFSSYNVDVKGSCIYYPIYMLMFINDEEIKLPKIDIADLSL